MNEEKYKKIERLFDILELISVGLLAIMLTVGFILTEKEKKKEASAQEVQYYLEAGVYILSGEPNNTNGGFIQLTEQEYLQNTITIKPNFRNETNDPDATFSSVLTFYVYSNLNYVAVEFDVSGDGNTGEAATPQEIWNAEHGWHTTTYNGTSETANPVESFTMVIKKRLPITQGIWKWFNVNTKPIESTTAQENYQNGYEIGYNQGVEDTISNNGGGFNGYENGYNAGKTQGYNEGYTQAMKEIDANNPYTFNNLIGAVMRAPSEFFKSFWGTEILGFNLNGLISVMFTFALVLSIFGIVKKFI